MAKNGFTINKEMINQITYFDKLESIMRKYFQSLLPTDRTTYQKKLELLGLNESDDPFVNLEAKRVDSSAWLDDVRKWPNLELPKNNCM